MLGSGLVLRIREKRLQEMKAAHNEKLENLSKGHGQYRWVTTARARSA